MVNISVCDSSLLTNIVKSSGLEAYSILLLAKDRHKERKCIMYIKDTTYIIQIDGIKADKLLKNSKLILGFKKDINGHICLADIQSDPLFNLL